MSKNALAFAGIFVAFACAAHAGDPITVGPVEAVAPNGLSITVLGQSFATSSRAVIPGAGANHVVAARSFAVGELVMVNGKRLSNGSLVAKSVVSVNDAYVPGATNVFLTGLVTAYDPSVGLAQIGATSIYVNEALLKQDFQFGAGMEVEVLGTQANPSGQVWASQIALSPKFLTREAEEVLAIVRGTVSISGTTNTQGAGLQSIQGTGVQSIQGTGIQSIQGTGVQSIQGTGIQSIQGTGVQSIQGTGIQSIQGTGVQSIQGTGIQSIQGTGVQSIQGTGIQSIQGTGVQSIQGTGVQSIQGTGIRSIQGTGVRSIQGTGVQ